MDLKALFENSVLNEETKQVVQEAFTTAVEAKEAELKEAYEAKLIEEKAEITSSMMELIEEAVTEEIQSISEEIVHARTLEVQYADKLQQFKESYAEAQDERMRVLVAESIAEELEELKEDIEMAKKHEFVMQMFESFKGTYEKLFGSADISVFDELEESKKELDVLRREKKLNELLEGLEGKKRSIAQTILESVATEKLDAKFEAIQGVLLSESKEEKEAPLTESKGAKGTVVLENEEEDEDEDEDNKDKKKKEEKDKEIKESVDPLVARLEKSLSWIKR